MKEIIKFNGHNISQGIVNCHYSDGTIELLPLYLEHYNRSPTGFSWGYAGSGPHQLAFSILFHYTNNKDFSTTHAHDLVVDFICQLSGDAWELPIEELIEFIEEQKNGH